MSRGDNKLIREKIDNEMDTYVRKNDNAPRIVLSKKRPVVRNYKISYNKAQLRSLTVENGVSGVIDFSIISGPPRLLWIDDLYINPEAFLIVKNMPSNSKFMISDENDTGMRFFDRIIFQTKSGFVKAKAEEYAFGWNFTPDDSRPWAPPPVPESTSYGAVFSLFALGVGFWQCRRRRESVPVGFTLQ